MPPPQFAEAVDLAIIAAKMSGGSQQNIDPGFKKLMELKDRVMTLGENPNQVADLFRTGSLDIGGIYSPAFFPDQIRKPEYKMGVTYGMKEGFATQLMFTVIPKSHPADSDLIHAFINHSLDAGVQGRMAADVLNGPVNSKAVIPAESRAFVPSPKQIDFRPGELLGSVSGELGLRRFLEAQGHTLVVTADKDGSNSVFERLRFTATRSP